MKRLLLCLLPLLLALPQPARAQSQFCDEDPWILPAFFDYMTYPDTVVHPCIGEEGCILAANAIYYNHILALNTAYRHDVCECHALYEGDTNAIKECIAEKTFLYEALVHNEQGMLISVWGVCCGIN